MHNWWDFTQSSLQLEIQKFRREKEIIMDTCRDQINVLTKQNMDANIREATLRDDKEKARHEIEALKGALSAKEQECQSLEKDCERISVAWVSQEKYLQQYRVEAMTLKDILAKMTEELESIQSDIMPRPPHLAKKLEKEIQELEGENGLLKASLKELEQRCKNTHEQNATLKSECSRLREITRAPPGDTDRQRNEFQGTGPRLGVNSQQQMWVEGHRLDALQNHNNQLIERLHHAEGYYHYHLSNLQLELKNLRLECQQTRDNLQTASKERVDLQWRLSSEKYRQANRVLALEREVSQL